MRRRLIQLGLFLLLGAIVNVAVAWTFALTIYIYDSGDRTLRTGDDVQWVLCRWIDFSGIAVVWASATPPVFPTKDFGPDTSHIAPDWLPLREWQAQPHDNSIRFVTREAEARGWPTLTLWSEKEGDFSSPETQRITGGIRTRFEPWRRAGSRIPRVLPLRPIWPGFAINTLFYAGILWLLFAAPFALRRRRRIKRGLCPACAYPVGASDICTECGKLVRAKGVHNAN